VDVETVVESLTVSVSAIDVTSLTYEEVASIIVEVSLDENNNTVTVTVETKVLVVSVVQSAQYVPIELPMFVTTMSRVEVQLDRYTTAPPAGMSNATMIGVATGGALIAALMGGVAVFLLRDNKEEEMDSDVDFEDLDDVSVRSIRSRSRSQAGSQRPDSDSELSEDDFSAAEDDQNVEGWAELELDQFCFEPSSVTESADGETWGAKSSGDSSSVEEDACEDLIWHAGDPRGADLWT
jgi:hypothetical protein